jgi:AcrR family transcriptional regulator
VNVQPAGLRELKKNQTRQLIADTARELFTARGFEAVTIDDVAQSAQVSKKTVFNYFATKEDLVLHRAEERELLVLATIRERAAGESLIDAFQRAALDRLTQLAEHLDPNRLGGFLRLVESSPALQRRMRELQAQLVVAATEALRAETGAAADDPRPAAVAEMILGAQRVLGQSLRADVLTGAALPAVARRQRRRIEEVFALLRGGLSDYPARVPIR